MSIGSGDVAVEPLDTRLKRLLVEHGPGIGRVVSGYVRNAAEHQDLMQELALALWRALPGFRGECSERTFVFRIVHNLGVNHITRRKPTEPPTEVPDPSPSPEGRAHQTQQRLRLMGAVKSLPLPQRQVIMLALEDCSHAEIAEVLGITVNNVGVRLNRAREALRQLLGEKP